MGSLKNSVDIRAIGAGDFTAMGVADEFADYALENAFLVGHEGGLERGQVPHFMPIGEFHGSLNRYLGEIEFLCKGCSLPLDRELFNVAILAALASDRIIEFESKAKGVDLGMAARTALELLMLEDGLADGGGSANVRFVDQYILRRLETFVV